jgi:hypothetical protein
LDEMVGMVKEQRTCSSTIREVDDIGKNLWGAILENLAFYINFPNREGYIRHMCLDIDPTVD